jgi:clan AA aspartic protease
MGAFRVHIEVGDREGQRFEALDALVDTGATYTRVPRSILQRLGHAPEEERGFILADGREVTYGLSWVAVRIEGRVHPTPVVFGDEGTEPLLGVVTLEESGLGVDAVSRRLVPTPASLKGLGGGRLVLRPGQSLARGTNQLPKARLQPGRRPTHGYPNASRFRGPSVLRHVHDA